MPFVVDARVHPSRLPCPYSYRPAFVRDLAFLPAGAREWVVGRGIVEWLGWTEPATETGSES